MAAELKTVRRTKMGANMPYFAPITTENAGTFPTYGTVEAFSEFVSLSEALEFAEASFYSNNRKSESSRVFKSGTLTYGNKGLSPDNIAKIYGAKLDESGELHYGVNNAAPRIGFGFYRELEDNGVRYYEGVYYPSCKASLEGETDNTRGENITYEGNTTVMEVYAIGNTEGDWKITEIFATADEAETWVKGKLGASA